MCVVWQNLHCRTQYGSHGPTSATKRRKYGATLFGWGDSLLRDMLDAGVLDCLYGEFDDIQVSVRGCVPSMWLTFVTNSADESLRWQIGVANLEGIGEQKGRASAQASGREDCQSRGRGRLLGSAELYATWQLHSSCCQDLYCAVLRG